MFVEYKLENLEQFNNALQKKLEHNEQVLDELLGLKDKSYDNFIKPLDHLEERLDRFFTPLSNENGVNATKQVQQVYAQAIPLLSKYYSKFTQNERLFSALEELFQDKSLNKVQKHRLSLEIKDFVLSGAKLEHEDKKRIEQIDLELGQLSNAFNTNLLKATDSFEIEVKKEDLGQMPQEDIDANTTEDGRYVFTLQMPSFIAFMTYCPDANLRQKVYKAYTTRAPENGTIIDAILRLRDEKAKIIGFENYSQYSIQSKTAKIVSEVNEFLTQLADAAKDKAVQELEELEEFAQKKLASYDLAYYSERLKKQKFDIDEQQLKPYFEKESVVAGLIELVSELFGLKFYKVQTPTWHEKVVVYEVDDGKNLSRLYLDLESRKNKRSGAWMSDFQTHFKDADGTIQPASAFIVCNFSPSSSGVSLLRHDDVVTLFHEMGHALHHMLSNVDERGVSGIHGVAWDVVEFPSQFLENFAYEPWVLQRFAKHYKTQEVIPAEFLQKIKESKNFQAAMGLMRQMEFSLFDFWLHQDLYSGEEVQELLDKVRKEYAVIQPPSYNRFQNGFAHIFAGGYSAGYYSYKWAEVMSADAFFACVQSSGIDTQKAKGYKHHILQQGASENMVELYHKWLGKDFDIHSLLKLYGLK